MALIAWMTACGGGGDGATASGTGAVAGDAAASAQGLSRQALLGQQIFQDTSLSGGGQVAQSCASCHDASVGHAGPLNGHITELGSDGVSVGNRVAPSIRYLFFNRQAFHFAEDGTPTGGFFWDGRADSLADQARQPFLNPAEMANTDAAAVIHRLSMASYAGEFKAVFGEDIFNRPDDAFTAVALALQAYQREDLDFRPFTSKYDAFLRGQATLTSSELRGLALFNNGQKGNCMACHPSGISADGTFPLFTDFSYDALGVPRNQQVPSTWGDKGLCASSAGAIQALPASQQGRYCGLFKVPSLRNVGLRKAYFHNGRFTHLVDVVTFYVQRDTNPERWYVDVNGQPDVKFNDLPAYGANVNKDEVPYDRHPGEAPRLTDAEVSDVVTFLCALSDGWTGAAQRCNR